MVFEDFRSSLHQPHLTPMVACWGIVSAGGHTRPSSSPWDRLAAGGLAYTAMLTVHGSESSAAGGCPGGADLSGPRRSTGRAASVRPRRRLRPASGCPRYAAA